MNPEYLDDDDFDPRETRLQAEFSEMVELIRPGSLVDFQCARMTQGELDLWLRPTFTLEQVERELGSFLEVDAFRSRWPELAPDKYLVTFSCTGLAQRASDPAAAPPPRGDPRAIHIPDDDDLELVDTHAFEIILALDYPEEAPRLVWLTRIFHPNITIPYLCTTGRPFAPGTHLKSICLMAGQMVQYRHFNLDSVLDRVARGWTERTLRVAPERLPLDRRDLLTGREVLDPLVEVLDREREAEQSIVEWLEEGW